LPIAPCSDWISRVAVSRSPQSSSPTRLEVASTPSTHSERFSSGWKRITVLTRLCRSTRIGGGIDFCSNRRISLKDSCSAGAGTLASGWVSFQAAKKSTLRCVTGSTVAR